MLKALTMFPATALQTFVPHVVSILADDSKRKALRAETHVAALAMLRKANPTDQTRFSGEAIDAYVQAVVKSSLTEDADAAVRIEALRTLKDVPSEKLVVDAFKPILDLIKADEADVASSSKPAAAAGAAAAAPETPVADAAAELLLSIDSRQLAEKKLEVIEL